MRLTKPTIKNFRPSGQSFDERMGDPTQFDAAIGQIAIAFSYLESVTRCMIMFLSGTLPTAGRILVPDAFFLARVDALSVLIAACQQQRPTAHEVEQLCGELLLACRRAEELRSTYVHSSEEVSPSLLLDVADFIVYVGMELEGLPLLLELADRSSSSDELLEYFKDGMLVARFKWASSAGTAAGGHPSILIH